MIIGQKQNWTAEIVSSRLLYMSTNLKTIGELRSALDGYDPNTPIDLFLLGEDRLEGIAVYEESESDTDYVWPMIVVDFKEITD